MTHQLRGPSCCPQHLGDLCFRPAWGSSCCVWLQPDLGTGAAGAEFPVRALGGAGQGCPEHGAGLQHPAGAVSSSSSPFSPPWVVAQHCALRELVAAEVHGACCQCPVLQSELRAGAELPAACVQAQEPAWPVPCVLFPPNCALSLLLMALVRQGRARHAGSLISWQGAGACEGCLPPAEGPCSVFAAGSGATCCAWGPLSFLFSCGTEHESLSATAGEPQPWASWKK